MLPIGGGVKQNRVAAEHRSEVAIASECKQVYIPVVHIISLSEHSILTSHLRHPI